MTYPEGYLLESNINLITTFQVHMQKKLNHEINLQLSTNNIINNISIHTNKLPPCNDSFNFTQMLKEQDSHLFLQEMKDEVNQHLQHKHFSLIPKHQIPSKSKIIQEIWTFKRKRTPDGQVIKHKARLCAHGGMQQWGNYLLGDLRPSHKLDFH